MSDFSITFYSLLSSSRTGSEEAAAKMLWHMPGGNHEKGIAEKLRKIADELDKIEESPF